MRRATSTVRRTTAAFVGATVWCSSWMQPETRPWCIAGNLYGTAQAGGAHSYGTVFKLDATGNFRVLHNFSETEGCFSSASLFRDAAGNLYGTTSGCGRFGAGTV